MIYEGIMRIVMGFFFKDYLIASDIIKIVKSPAKGSLLPGMNIQIGMEEGKIRRLLGEFILRDHIKPIDGIDAVISVNYWPEIYRFVFSDRKLVAVIVEIGISYRNFKKVYHKVEDRITELFAFSIQGLRNEYSSYPTYSWNYAEHYCSMWVLSDRIQYVDPYLYDWNLPYFGEEINGTFITKKGNGVTVLPTIGIIFALQDDIRKQSTQYINLDLANRCGVTSDFPPGQLLNNINRGNI